MVYGPITSWQIDGETMKTVTDYFLGLQNHWRWWLHHEIKRHMLLGRKVMTNTESILKNRDIILLTKVHRVKAMVFPVVMYGCELWTIEKADRWRTDAFKLRCWRSILKAPSTARRSNQSILREINPEYSFERLMLKFQYFGYLMQSQLIGKDPDAEKDWRQEERGTTKDEMVTWHYGVNGHEFEQTPGDCEGQGNLVCLQRGVAKSQTWLNNWTTTTKEAKDLFTETIRHWWKNRRCHNR